MTQELSTRLRTGGMVATGHADTAANQYLTFTLAGEEYGVDILRVQEIKGWTPVTHIPNAPEFLKGVLNLRGAIVPIVDLRVRFSLDCIEYTPTTVVIVLSIHAEGRERTFGIVVDAVSDVLNIPADEVRPKPDFGSVVDADFISGLATVNEQMVMLLDIDRLLRHEDVNRLSSLSE